MKSVSQVALTVKQRFLILKIVNQCIQIKEIKISFKQQQNKIL